MNINALWKIAVGDEFEITVNRAINHMKDTSGVLGEGWVVGHHNNSIAGLVNTVEFLHYGFRTFSIETTGRLVGKNDFRINDQGASNSNTLFLTAGELVWIIIFFGLKIEIF